MSKEAPNVGLGWVRTQLPQAFVDPPEVWKDCAECGGEGSIEVWESVSKWSIDPPCAPVDPHRAQRACSFYSGTFCTTCRAHFPVGESGEFTWYEMDGREGPKVGT